MSPPTPDPPVHPGRARLPDFTDGSGTGPVSVPVVTAELLAKYAQPAPRYTSYPPIPVWSRSVGATEYRSALDAVARAPDELLSLYVHLPFCRQRCLYCGCNVVITRRRGMLETYLGRLRQELDLVTGILGRGRAVAQLHLGGGTPNYLDDGELERLWRMIEERFTLMRDADTSVEADPRLSGPEQLRTLHALGFRRVSFGVQDLEPQVQQAIGRVHPSELVRRTIEAAREAGFAGISIDLMYGLPEQTADRFRRTIETIVELAPDRVACFGYAHVPALKPHQRALERYQLPNAVERLGLNQSPSKDSRPQATPGSAWITSPGRTTRSPMRPAPAGCTGTSTAIRPCQRTT